MKNNIINKILNILHLIYLILTLYIFICNQCMILYLLLVYNSDNYIRVKLNSIDNIFITSKIIDYSNSYI